MYNEKIKSYIDAYVEKNREKINAYHNEYNKKKYKERYENDIEFRENEKKKSTERRMLRYNTDPEFKKMVNDKRKALYQKKKLLKQTASANDKV